MREFKKINRKKRNLVKNGMKIYRGDDEIMVNFVIANSVFINVLNGDGEALKAALNQIHYKSLESRREKNKAIQNNNQNKEIGDIGNVEKRSYR